MSPSTAVTAAPDTRPFLSVHPGAGVPSPGRPGSEPAGAVGAADASPLTPGGLPERRRPAWGEPRRRVGVIVVEITSRSWDPAEAEAAPGIATAADLVRQISRQVRSTDVVLQSGERQLSVLVHDVGASELTVLARRLQLATARAAPSASADVGCAVGYDLGAAQVLARAQRALARGRAGAEAPDRRPRRPSWEMSAPGRPLFRPPSVGTRRQSAAAVMTSVSSTAHGRPYA
jgi:hypothetical protein